MPNNEDDPKLRSYSEYENQSFVDLEFTATHFEEINFNTVTFDACRFSDSTFKSSIFTECTFKNCGLGMLHLPHSQIKNTRFLDCNLSGINWTEAAWPHIRIRSSLSFRRCSLSHSTFIGMSLKDIQILDCSAHNVDFREADLTHADFSGTDLRASLFQLSNLTGANFSKARNYTINPANNILKQTRFSLPEALALLYSMDIILDEE